MKTALYAGTFDPVTNGHLDLIERARKLFDRLIVAVAENPGKGPLFTVEERIALVRENLSANGKIEVRGFSNLMVEFARECGAHAVIRGLRAISDFEFEFQMAQMNRHLDDSLETVFLMPTEEHFYTSSSIIKQVAAYGGDIAKFVPANVEVALRTKFAGKA